MPPKSKNQAIAMNLAHAVQTGQAKAKPGSPSAEIAKSMPPSKMGDFTGPVPAGLPKRVGPAAPPPAGRPATPAAPPMQNVGGPGPGRPGMKVKNVGKPVKKMRFM